MDRPTFYRAEVLYEDALMSGNRYAMESIGLLIADLIGVTTQVARLPCTPTSPASLAVKVGPGAIYSQQSLEATAVGVRLSTGGLAADTNVDHKIMKQGLLRDTQTFSITPPATSGQSQCFLIEAQFQELDDAAVTTQIYNTLNPNAPITERQSPARRCLCALQMKAGTAATTGSQTAPTADAGWVPVWVITVAHSDTSIGSGAIVAAAGAPFVSVGSGGGSSTVVWTSVTSNYTASPNDRLVADTTAGAFTVTLPAAPVSDSTTVRIKGNFATHNLTVSGNGHSWAGFSDPLILNKDYIDVTILFDGTNWRI